MSECIGNVSVGAQTDREMATFLREEANRLGVSQSELLRRLFEHYRECRERSFSCPTCEETLEVEL